jgi:outer membrane autotransporter protein
VRAEVGASTALRVSGKKLDRTRWLGATRAALIGIALLCASSPAFAQGVPGAGPLVQLTAGNPAFDDLERAAAIANQSVFNALASPCSDGPGSSCTAQQFQIFSEVRALVATAEELNTGQPNAFSLGLDAQGLAEALRWTAAEEVSAKSRVATEFANGQVVHVTNRITALRFGATGFSVADAAALRVPESLGLADDAALGPAGAGATLSKWGGFANASYGWGDHDPTTFEDAFDYDNLEFTGGVDYRLSPHWVAGLVAGYSDSDLDFDPSKSVVDGGIDAQGFSTGIFGLFTWGDVYASGFFDYQRLDFDIDRFIRYPSVDTHTEGDTSSDAFTITANTGYTYRFGPGASKPFLLEPSVRVEYDRVTIDGYTEKDRDPSETFALRVAEQDFDSLELALGLRGSVAVSTPIGVFFPYARGEFRFEFIDDVRTTTSQYGGLGSVVDPSTGSLAPFVLDGEDVDRRYGTVVAGVQAIVLGGTQRELGGPIAGRLSLFAEYHRVFELSNITNQMVTGGIRYTF